MKTETKWPACARAVVVNPAGQVLLLLRPKDADLAPSTWCLPGGDIEDGETPLDGARRELQEETGLVAGSAARSVEFTFPGGAGTAFLFEAGVADIDGGADFGVATNDESAAFGWFAPHALPQPLLGATDTVIGQLLHTTPRADTGSADVVREQFRLDRGTMGKVTRTSQGFMRVDDNVATRTGVFTYRLRDGSVRRELRHPDEVGRADSLKTLAAVPVTDEHPPDMVTAANAKQHMRGYTGDEVRFDGGLVKVGTTITDSLLIGKVETKKARELSCGYVCDLVMEPGTYQGEAYDARQTNIIYNHLAVVPKGRAGPVARLNLDAAEAISPDDPGEGEPTPMAKITIDGVEYEVTEPVALAVTTKLRGDAATIQGLEAQLTTARKDATDSQTKATEVQATADKQQARADQAEAKLNERKDTDIGPLVRARIALEKQAGPILGADVKLDDMDDKAIKVAVVKAASPSVVLEGKSDAYLDASYDLIVAGGGDRKDHAADLRRGATPVPASGKGGQEQRVDADEERQKMILRNREMWKNKEGN